LKSMSLSSSPELRLGILGLRERRRQANPIKSYSDKIRRIGRFHAGLAA
jgi:hypothetical protein